MTYKGVVIEESLENKSVLDDFKILSTKVELITPRHKTPWIKQWTLHTVEIPQDKAMSVAERISKSLDSEHGHAWYADFKSENDHYIIFRNKVFHVTDRRSKEQYDAVTQYGISLGIPDYQLNFSPHIKQ